MNNVEAPPRVVESETLPSPNDATQSAAVETAPADRALRDSLLFSSFPSSTSTSLVRSSVVCDV